MTFSTIYRMETSTNQIHFSTSVIFFGRQTVISNITTAIKVLITRNWTRQLEFSKIHSMLNGQLWQWEIQYRKIHLWIATNFEILRRDLKKLSSFKCDFKFWLFSPSQTEQFLIDVLMLSFYCLWYLNTFTFSSPKVVTNKIFSRHQFDRNRNWFRCLYLILS